MEKSYFFMKQLSSLEGFDDLRFLPFTPRIDPRLKDEFNAKNKMKANKRAAKRAAREAARSAQA